MPGPRGTVALCDQIDCMNDVAERLLQEVDHAILDGRVSPVERRRLAVAGAELRRAKCPLAGMAAEADGAMRAIGAIAGSGRVSDHAFRVVKEGYEDRRALAS
jgi:predicted kinase